jgi:hypothetical protein
MTIRSLFICLIVVVVFQRMGHAQILEPGCESRSPMYANAFAMHLQNRNLFSMEEVLEQWVQDCGYKEPVFRAAVLVQIMKGEFPVMAGEPDFLNQAIAYEIRYKLIENEDQKTRDEYFAVYREYFGYVQINSNFDRSTIQISRELLASFRDKNDLTYAFLTLFAGNTKEFFQLLKNDQYPETTVSDDFHKRVASLKRKPEFNFGIHTGIWFPSGDLQVIGNKPIVGVFTGISRLHSTINVLFEMRFGNTASPFLINVKDTLVETRIHHGSYLGLEGNHIVIKHKKVRLGFFVSAGYNVIDIIEEALLVPERQTFGSWSVQAGPFADIVFGNRTRMGIKPAYIFLDHHHNEGSSLEGNAFVLKLVFGYSENARKYVNLRRMGY